MADWIEGPFSDRILGYCTNVHAGNNLEQYLNSLERYACSVRDRVALPVPLPLGLWWSAPTISQLRQEHRLADFWRWLADRRLCAFTVNAFPFAGFHEPVVKHRVYQPDWSDARRRSYTEGIIQCLRDHPRPPSEFSISTIPLGWGKSWPDKRRRQAVTNLVQAREMLRIIEQRDGTACHIDIEPEPGCLLDRSADVIDFFQHHLLADTDTELTRRHLRICHDICHAAVMFEDQAEMFRRYDEAGIKVGKVQVSNAIRVDFDALSQAEKSEALQQLKAFEEDRYLHQTCIRDNATGAITFHEDLPLATRAAEERGEPVGEWRIHFHVPIYLESFGLLGTTRAYIDDCLELMKPKREVKHFEVETYAWNVLPPELRKDDLAEGIADELIWLRDRMAGDSA